MENKPEILIISYSNLNTDPRVLRQIDFLGSYYKISTAGFCSSCHKYEKEFTKISEVVNFHHRYPFFFRKLIALFFSVPYNLFHSFVNEYIFLRAFKNYESHYWSFLRKKTFKKLAVKHYRIVIANDINSLPLACKIKQVTNAKIYFDAHEYSPLEYDNNSDWLKYYSPYVTYLCKKYIPLSDYNTTVSKGIAKEYQKLTKLPFDIVLNAPSYLEINPVFRNDGIIKFIHHGGVMKDRNTDRLIEAFIKSDRSDIELHLMIINLNSDYGQYIKKLAKRSSKIFFHQPVPTNEIAGFINRFDVGIYFLPPLNFNQLHALPNKFFEFIQARLMLAFGPGIEMQEYIDEFELGVIGSGYEVDDILNCINGITDNDVKTYKEKVNAAAISLSSENSMNMLKNNLDRLCAE
jgi:glycosyltransferase involved in cell wall biosynthesis